MLSAEQSEQIDEISPMIENATVPAQRQWLVEQNSHQKYIEDIKPYGYEGRHQAIVFKALKSEWLPALPYIIHEEYPHRQAAPSH